MSYEITKRLEFDAGHRVPLHESKCKTPHGHRYTAEITCTSSSLTPEGFVIDFGKIKAIVGAWIDNTWDHTFIIQRGDAVMEAFAEVCGEHGFRTFYVLPDAPTAENMAKHLYEVATHLLSAENIRVVEVALWETPTCVARWKP